MSGFWYHVVQGFVHGGIAILLVYAGAAIWDARRHR